MSLVVKAQHTVEDFARIRVSRSAIYGWKTKYGRMDVRAAEKTKHLRDEHSRLKNLAADLGLGKDMLWSLITKKPPWLASGRAEIGRSLQGYRDSELLEEPRSSWRYKSRCRRRDRMIQSAYPEQRGEPRNACLSLTTVHLQKNLLKEG
jgi:hypothetical protein